MSNVIAIANQKGGVGKTTTTRNLGAALAEAGSRVLMVDLDSQANLSLVCGVTLAARDRSMSDVMVGGCALDEVICSISPGLDLAPSSMALAAAEVSLVSEIGREQILRSRLASCCSRYDFTLIDCGPTFGVLTINALVAARRVLIPVQCEYSAYRGMQGLLQNIAKVRDRLNADLTILGILPTFYDPRRVHDQETLAQMGREYPALLIDITIRRRVTLADAGVQGRSVLDVDPESDAAGWFRALAKVARRPTDAEGASHAEAS
jgi:chromosome partitioning protein